MNQDRRPSANVPDSVGLLQNVIRQMRLAWRLFNDRRVPGWVKVIPVAGLIYLISPIDLLPDFLLPGLGELDDVTALVLAFKMFVDLSPPSVVQEHLANLAGRIAGRPSEPQGEYIEVPYRVLGDEDLPREQ